MACASPGLLTAGDSPPQAPISSCGVSWARCGGPNSCRTSRKGFVQHLWRTYTLRLAAMESRSGGVWIFPSVDHLSAHRGGETHSLLSRGLMHDDQHATTLVQLMPCLTSVRTSGHNRPHARTCRSQSGRRGNGRPPPSDFERGAMDGVSHHEHRLLHSLSRAKSSTAPHVSDI